MKTKVTITLDEELVPDAKRFARSHGVSLSRLVEETLRTRLSTAEGPTFSERWRGNFRPAEREDSRYKQLAEKYL